MVNLNFFISWFSLYFGFIFFWLQKAIIACALVHCRYVHLTSTSDLDLYTRSYMKILDFSFYCSEITVMALPINPVAVNVTICTHTGNLSHNANASKVDNSKNLYEEANVSKKILRNVTPKRYYAFITLMYTNRYKKKFYFTWQSIHTYTLKLSLKCIGIMKNIFW